MAWRWQPVKTTDLRQRLRLTTPINRIFTFIHCNQTEFANCSHVSARHDPVHALQLTIDDSAVTSVQEATDAYFADEVLNDRRCDAGGVLCGTLGQTTQRHSVSDAPLAAVISLKRFQHDETIVGQVAEGSELVCTRLCKAISYSPAFQIPLTDGSYSQYDVDAIVCHVPDKKRPSAGDRGPYVAFVVRTGADGTRRYYKMDDRRRTEVDEATFLAQQENVFMLFGSLSGQSNDPMLISETIATSRSVAVEAR